MVIIGCPGGQNQNSCRIKKMKGKRMIHGSEQQKLNDVATCRMNRKYI